MSLLWEIPATAGFFFMAVSFIYVPYLRYEGLNHNKRRLERENGHPRARTELIGLKGQISKLEESLSVALEDAKDLRKELRNGRLRENDANRGTDPAGKEIGERKTNLSGAKNQSRRLSPSRARETRELAMSMKLTPSSEAGEVLGSPRHGRGARPRPPRQ